MSLRTLYLIAFGSGILLTVLCILIAHSLPSQYRPSRNPASPTGLVGASGGPSEDQHAKCKTSVQVIVLGDIGRSPRMQYHALSLAKHGARVDIVGFKESEIHPEIQSSENIEVVSIAATPQALRTSSKILFLVLAPLKVLHQVWSLYRTLGYATAPAEWMLMQNPPSIPTIAIAVVVCKLRNTKLVIDWHNFGYSVLALRLGSSHPLVRFSKWYEFKFSRAATAHFAVTNAMSRYLNKMAKTQALPLHDRPYSNFHTSTIDQRYAFLSTFEGTADYADSLENGSWKLVVSSTSWTPDEDFSILLDALVEYSANTESSTKLPKILAIITGKGPQKPVYMERIQMLTDAGKLARVTVLTAWLSTENYAALLAAADLGVSLHKSTSGVDLPMKVVDMFGAGLPVLGWSRFEAWPELVQEDVNGKGFGSAEELHNLLVTLFEDGGARLAKLKKGAMREGARRWDDEWDPVAGQLFGVT